MSVVLAHRLCDIHVNTWQLAAAILVETASILLADM